MCEMLSLASYPFCSVWSTLGQLTVLLLAAFSYLVVLYGLSFGVLPYCIDTFPILGILIVVWLSRPLLGWLWLPLSVLMTRLVKQVLIGTYKPGRFSVWSGFYVRHWIVRSISRSIPWSLVSGTVLHNWVLRQLGAKIGANVYLHRGVVIGNVAGISCRLVQGLRW